MSIIWSLVIIINGTPYITSAQFDTLKNCRDAIAIIESADTDNLLSVSCVATEVSVVS